MNDSEMTSEDGGLFSKRRLGGTTIRGMPIDNDLISRHLVRPFYFPGNWSQTGRWIAYPLAGASARSCGGRAL